MQYRSTPRCRSEAVSSHLIFTAHCNDQVKDGIDFFFVFSLSHCQKRSSFVKGLNDEKNINQYVNDHLIYIQIQGRC